MVSRLLLLFGLALGLMLAFEPLATAQDPAANPPAVLIATDIDVDGNLVLVTFETIIMRPASPTSAGGQRVDRIVNKIPLKGVKIRGGDGNEISVEAARKRLGGKDTAILALSWEEPLSPIYRRLFRDDVLVFVFPKNAPVWKKI